MLWIENVILSVSQYLSIAHACAPGVRAVNSGPALVWPPLHVWDNRWGRAMLLDAVNVKMH